MKRTLFTTALVISLVFTISLAVSAGEPYVPDEITKVERVRATGIKFFGIRLFGGFATAPEEPSLFGAASPMFRLNDDDKTVFRGLGRESGVAQWILPTLHSRQNLRSILYTEELTSRSLVKFDSQIATGEKIHMISTGAVVSGKIALLTGIVMALSGNENAVNIWKVGAVLWGAGKFGQLGGTIVTKQAFAHLNDATRAYNNR